MSRRASGIQRSPVDRLSAEDLLVRELPTVAGIVRGLAARYRLEPDERDDVLSWVHVKLVEDDYAVLRKFEGRSSLRTYLGVVIANLFRDYRIRKWGRWRPSAVARRAGDVGVRLERLVDRDGHSLDQAIRILRSAGPIGMTDRELFELAASFPERGRPRVESVGGDIDRTAGDATAEQGLASSELAARTGMITQALQRALDGLGAEDRLILKLKFWEDFTVADIARTLHLEQRPLYRRVNRLLEELRGSLRGEGFTLDDVRGLFGDWEGV